MGQMLKTETSPAKGWLLFFYSVPSKPVSNRMRIWRRLVQAGALPFKGAAYLLPYKDEHYELCQWLVGETVSMGGEAAFVHIQRVEPMDDSEIIELFNRQREYDYQDIDKELEGLERKIQGIKKGGSIGNEKLSEQFYRLLKGFESIKAIDFFSSKAGILLNRRIEKLQTGLKGIGLLHTDRKPSLIVPKQINDYQGKTWVTRKEPFVDRMASAWLIKRFIDPSASFGFIDERRVSHLSKDMVAFDILGGEFTHISDLCTFEVLIRSFNLDDRRLKKIAEIVHNIDLKDEKFKTPEAKGLEEILKGIRKTSKSDSDALERGMVIFELLYESKV